MDKILKIAVAGTGYVGLSIATLLAQHHEVCAIDVIPAKVDLINRRKSPIRDEYIEKYLAEKELKLTATLDPAQAYSGADFVVIAAPTNYDSRTQHFDTSAVEAVIQLVMQYNPNAVMVIKSTIPVGYTVSVREKFGSSNIIFSPEFLREGRALHDNLHPSRIIVGDGSDEVIDLLFRICVEPGVNNAVAFMPCFGIYTTQAALCGVELRQTPVNADFSFPWDNLLKLVDDKTSLVFVTTPDNPSGYTPPVAELETLAKALPDTCLLVLDEAYMDFTDDEADYSLAKRLDEFPNVIISRTFSKSFGMAGLRLGYAIVPEELADHYWRVRLPFSVNLMAEEAGIAALQDVAFHDETVRVVREGRAWLTGELTKLGCRVFPSQSNFLMFELPADGPNAASLFEDLLRRGIILRPLTSYGLPRNLRVSVGTAEENTMLINAMRELL